MASQTVYPEYRASLGSILLSWDRRLRQRQGLAWLPRSLMPGLILGIILAVISRARPWLLNEQILAITLAALALSAGVMLAAVWLWPRSPLHTARQLDLSFRLQERVSTALELLEGRIAAQDELALRQLEDARSRAQTVNYRERIPLTVGWREWVTLAGLALAFAVLLLLPNPQQQLVQQSSAQNAAIVEATDVVKELTQEIAADTRLTDQQREQLLETLQSSLQTLQEENITPEEAFATVSEVKTQFQEQSDLLNQQLLAQQAALRDAASQLDQLSGAQPQEQNQQNGNQSNDASVPFSDAAHKLLEQLGQMTPSELAQAADKMEQTAQSMQSTDPQAAQALRDAAEAIRNGDLEAARESLERAAQSATQNQQNQSTQEQTAQQLQNASRQLQESANQIAQQNQAQTQAQGEAPGTQAGETQSQSGSQGQEGDQPGGNSQSGQTGTEGSTNTSEGQQSLDSQSADGSGSGSGDAPGDAQSNVQNQSSSADQIDQNNNPDGQGVGQYESVYDPHRIGGQSDNQLVLPPDQSDVPFTEGQFDENPTGDVTIPYNEVFRAYRDALDRALESDYIPLGLRDVIHDYFASLEPR